MNTAKNLIFILCVALAFTSCSTVQAQEVKDGDIIFIENPSGQGKAIQLATKSKFTHVGIVFFENGKPMVYHAVQPVSVNTLEEFRSMSSNKKYEIRRLKDQSVLTAERIGKMRQYARSMVGKNYDIYFSWADDEWYCSEYVWKILNRHTMLEVGPLRPLKEFDLSSPAVKEIMARRYGNNIPYDEKMISPGDMYSSELLESPAADSE